jgi:N6-adenosine-specific RNA methylase IME4
LKEAIADYLKENVHYFNYKILSELAVIYASKMDKHYQRIFFDKMFKEKFLKELRFLDSETFYKVLWSLVKAKAISVNEESGSDWT